MTSPREQPAAAVTDPAELPPGAVIDGRYRVVRIIGVGGTGIVYEVEALFTNQRLALKTLLDPQHAPRLEQEARALAKLKSSHVVKVVDFGQAEVGPYMVMTLLVGKNLRDVLEARTKASLAFVANLTLQLCEGLDEAHEAGLVHRDLKPDNLHLASDGDATNEMPVVTVFDFGVVKMASELNNPLTRTGSTVGTPYYMSLEQLRGAGTVDAVSDVYATCVMLYECFAGQRPFEAGTLGDLIFAICSTNPSNLASLRPDLPAAVAEVIMRGLSRDKAQRPQSMRELARAFAPHADPSLRGWLDASTTAPSQPTSDPAAKPAAPSAGIKSPASGLRIPPPPSAAPEKSGAAEAVAALRPPPRPAGPAPRPNIPRPPAARPTARALPNPALLAASANDMAAISEPVAPLASSEQAAKSVTSEGAASSGGDALFDKPLAGINTKSNGEQNGKGNSVATATTAALPAQSPAPPAAAPTTPAAEAAAAIRANAGSSAQQTPLVSQPTQVLDELSDSVSATPKDDRAPSVPDRETPTEMFIPKVHGELGSEELSVNGSGNIPTMDLPTGQLDGARALSREDKTALLDLNALQRNPPNPAPSYATKTAPPPPPSQSGVGFPPSSSQPRPFSASSPSLPSFADPNNVSGSYSHPGTPGVRAGQSPSISAPSSQSPLVHKIDRALTKVGHAGNQLGLKVLVHFRSASQEQQILFVVVGTATIAVVAVMLFYLIFL